MLSIPISVISRTSSPDPKIDLECKKTVGFPRGGNFFRVYLVYDVWYRY